MKTMSIALSVLAVLAALLVAGCQATRAGYEYAPYKIVRTDGKFQLRDYPAIAVVETPMHTPDARDGSFRRLFRFITGANETRQKIAMTTPVFMAGSDSNATMQFVLPAKLKADAVPSPEDGTVTVRELPEGRFAVLRYSGSRNSTKEKESLARLRSWLEQEQLTEASGPVFAYFDPPWTPPFLRRNEVMLLTQARRP